MIQRLVLCSTALYLFIIRIFSNFIFCFLLLGFNGWYVTFMLFAAHVLHLLIFYNFICSITLLSNVILVIVIILCSPSSVIPVVGLHHWFLIIGVTAVYVVSIAHRLLLIPHKFAFKFKLRRIVIIDRSKKMLIRDNLNEILESLWKNKLKYPEDNVRTGIINLNDVAKKVNSFTYRVETRKKAVKMYNNGYRKENNIIRDKLGDSPLTGKICSDSRAALVSIYTYRIYRTYFISCMLNMVDHRLRELGCHVDYASDDRLNLLTSSPDFKKIVKKYESGAPLKSIAVKKSYAQYVAELNTRVLVEEGKIRILSLFFEKIVLILLLSALILIVFFLTILKNFVVGDRLWTTDLIVKLNTEYSATIEAETLVNLTTNDIIFNHIYFTKK